MKSILTIKEKRKLYLDTKKRDAIRVGFILSYPTLRYVGLVKCI